MKRLLGFLALAALLPFSVLTGLPAYGQVASAHVEGGDCVIHDFTSDITLNTDSSLDITEDLVVDCGNLPDKHGIFRILPTKSPVRPSDQYRRTPVTLISITDFSGSPHPYETIGGTNTVTWKIGDPNVTITGLNEYRIKYTVENAVYLDGDKDVWYWNLNGNFWDLETESYQATIHFPDGLDQDNVQVQLFSGNIGSTANSFSKSEWQDDRQTLTVTATVPLSVRQGITLKAAFPQNIITRYQPNFFQLYGGWLWYLPLLGLLFIAYRLWFKYGRDPRLGKPLVVQYEPPAKLRPMELGLVDSFGMMRTQFLSATIVDLAVRKHLKIEEVPKQGLLGKKDWRLTKLAGNAADLKPFENTLMDKLFGGSDSTLLSEHKNEFYKYIDDIKKEANKELETLGVFDPSSKSGWIYLAVLTAVEIALYFVLGIILLLGANDLQIIPHGLIAFVLSGMILGVFAILMPRRTVKGAQMKHHLDGFREYLSRAEKYRMQFYEKENIFEKYLPYAVVFGVTDKWIKAFKELVGYEKAMRYAPAWYVATSGQAFAIDSFTSQMNSLASDISSSLSSAPGGSGGGGAGGGGGGGGGGSW